MPWARTDVSEQRVSSWYGRRVAKSRWPPFVASLGSRDRQDIAGGRFQQAGSVTAVVERSRQAGA